MLAYPATASKGSQPALYRASMGGAQTRPIREQAYGRRNPYSLAYMKDCKFLTEYNLL